MGSEEVQKTISANVQQQMESDKVKVSILQNIAQQKQIIIDTNMASDDVTSKIKEAVSGASAGAAALKNVEGQLEQYNEFYKGLLSYTSGVENADEAVKQLSSGANSLAGYMKDITDGLAELDSAVKQLAEETSSLPDGVNQLHNGAIQLSDGLKQLNDDGIQKIADLVNVDLMNIRTRIQAMLDISKDYKNYSGISDSMDGSVKFIYKTDSIG